MINEISLWAKQIIICVVVVTILEMILPKGNSKKYIKTIMGVYILYTIISPAVKLITGKQMKVNYSDYEKYFGEIELQSELQTTTQEGIYQAELEKKLKADIENLGFHVTKIKAELNLEKGSITKITMEVKKEDKKKKANQIDIGTIQIGENTNDENLAEIERQKIEEKLTKDYGVDLENVFINEK